MGRKALCEKESEDFTSKTGGPYVSSGKLASLLTSDGNSKQHCFQLHLRLMLAPTYPSTNIRDV